MSSQLWPKWGYMSSDKCFDWYINSQYQYQHAYDVGLYESETIDFTNWKRKFIQKCKSICIMMYIVQYVSISTINVLTLAYYPIGDFTWKVVDIRDSKTLQRSFVYVAVWLGVMSLWQHFFEFAAFSFVPPLSEVTLRICIFPLFS